MSDNKLMLKKFIIRAKFQLKQMYKDREPLREENHKLKKTIEENNEIIKNYKTDNSAIKDIYILKGIKDLELKNANFLRKIDENKDKLKQSSEEINKIGDLILNFSLIIDETFTLNEKIDLISGNTESCNEIIKYFRDNDSKEPGFLDLIMQHGEYQMNKQRCKDFVDCPYWEMPLFNATLQPMFKKMDDAGISIMDCPVFEQMPYYTMDNRGNMVRSTPEVVRQEENVTIVRF